MPKIKKTNAQIRAAKRSRNFATLVYPDSCAADWQSQLAGLHVPVLVSPLHDQDLNPDGSAKKPHWHVLIMFDSPKDFENQVKPIFDKLKAVGREAVTSTRGYARYLCHQDNPEKHQYDPKDVVSFGGADYAAITRLASDVRQITTEIMQWCAKNQIWSMAELLDYAAKCQPDWYDVLCSQRAYIVSMYLKSMIWEAEHNYVRFEDRTDNNATPEPAPPKCKVVGKKIIDVESGEIVGTM